MSIVKKLTEGIVNRDLAQEGAALIGKWEQTGLLEGLHNDHVRNGMARLLENQAKELLRETSSMQVGDVEGFAAVAFPLVRRVFGALIANELVSVQPMSLPSGLIFFLDFVFSANIGGGNAGEPRLGNPLDTSIYGQGRVGAQIISGALLNSGSTPQQGPYALNNGYSSPTGSQLIYLANVAGGDQVSGTFGSTSNLLDQLCQYDPDLVSGSTVVCVMSITSSGLANFNYDDLVALTIGTGSNSLDANAGALANGTFHQRRLTSFSGSARGTGATLNVVFTNDTGRNLSGIMSDITGGALTVTWPRRDVFATGGALGSVVGATPWSLEGSDYIPEIDIKIDSVAVTAITKKLKAKWTPELGQDLNAYHNLDAEVELTQILSEQIALEIDQEILTDLIKGATADTRYWSRSPGQFVVAATGVARSNSSGPPDFTGNVSEWYETLVEAINDVSAQIHRKTLRGAANFVVCGPEVANILEFTAGFRANVTADSDKGEIGAVKVGSLSKKFDVIVDPYFVRNLVLVGRRGSSFLESGYVYAPYVPLQTTPTIFGVEDFVPRKGVMTRYAKQMVRPDMYGLVIIRDL
jgi:hypothetical protein